jgi:putative membrane protein insertion efficiency factor
MIRRALGGLSWLVALLLIAAVRCYQVAVRPILPPLCRFTPSCSEYMIAAIEKHGPFRGTGKGLWRLCRCNPWHPGGYDPP